MSWGRRLLPSVHAVLRLNLQGVLQYHETAKMIRNKGVFGIHLSR